MLMPQGVGFYSLKIVGVWRCLGIRRRSKLSTFSFCTFLINRQLTMNTRINYIDRIKGFTILLVVLGHIYLFLLNFSDTFVSRFIGSCHMFIFMFISGFVAYIPDETLTRKNIARLKRRFLSYICPSIFICSVSFLYLALIAEKGWGEGWQTAKNYWVFYWYLLKSADNFSMV